MVQVAADHRHDFGGGDACRICGKQKAAQGRRPVGRGATAPPPATRHELERGNPVGSGDYSPSPPSPDSSSSSSGSPFSRASAFGAGRRSDGDDAAQLADVLRGRHANGAAAPANTNGRTTGEAARPPSWCGFAGSIVGDGLISLCKGLLRRNGTEPGPVDPRKKAGLDDALGRQLAVWFPDKELPPWGEALMILGAIAGGMQASGRPIPKPADTAGSAASSVFDAAATSATSGSTPMPAAGA
jgi:hypothetical protein